MVAHGPGGELAAQSHLGDRNTRVQMLSLVLGYAIILTVLLQLISTIPVSAPIPLPSLNAGSTDLWVNCNCSLL